MDFYEDDEPAADVRAAFESGPHGRTAPTRHRVVSFRLTNEEYAALQRLAARTGATVSEVARRAVCQPTAGLRLFSALPTTVTTTLAAPVTLTWKAA